MVDFKAYEKVVKTYICFFTDKVIKLNVKSCQPPPYTKAKQTSGKCRVDLNSNSRNAPQVIRKISTENEQKDKFITIKEPLMKQTEAQKSATSSKKKCPNSLVLLLRLI